MQTKNKQKIMDDLKTKCSAFKNYYAEKNNASKLNIYTQIESILNTENAFDKIDSVVAINIINDLVNNKTKAKQIYLTLIAE